MDEKHPDIEQQAGKHKRDVWLQILLPVLLLVAASLGFMIYLILKGSSGMQTASTWSQIAVIWLILPALFAGILLFGLIFLMIRGLRKFHAWLPPKFRLFGKTMNALNTSAARVAENSTAPFISIRARLSGVEALFSLARRKKNKSSEE